MEYIITPGAKINSELVYVPSEKFLYTKNKTNSDGSITYICHDFKTKSCQARITLINEHLCKQTEKSKKHKNHENHEMTYKKNFVHDHLKKKVIDIANACGWQSEKISLKPILQQVLKR